MLARSNIVNNTANIVISKSKVLQAAPEQKKVSKNNSEILATDNLIKKQYLAIAKFIMPKKGLFKGIDLNLFKGHTFRESVRLVVEWV